MAQWAKSGYIGDRGRKEPKTALLVISKQVSLLHFITLKHGTTKASKANRELAESELPFSCYLKMVYHIQDNK